MSENENAKTAGPPVGPSVGTPAGTLLVEARTEELPPQLLRGLAAQFPQTLLANLRRSGFADDESFPETDDGERDGNPKLLATPRRIVALLRNIRRAAADRMLVRRGPQVTAALDKDGRPTKALEGFLRATGKAVGDLRKLSERGREYFAVDLRESGGTLDDRLAAIVQESLLSLNAPRLMRWGANDWRFIRPLRGLAMLWESEAIAGEVMGVRSGRTTLGHRFMSEGPVEIRSAGGYEGVMEGAKVVVDFDARKKSIVGQMEKMRGAGEFVDPDETKGGMGNAPAPIVREDNPLLAEVAAICEWPAVHRLPISYGDAFSAPLVCVKACIGEQQKGFLVDGGEAPLADCFVIADNAPENPEAILRGFKSVINARLRDIQFYHEADRKLSLAACCEKLRSIAYHSKLGSQHDRVERVRKIAASIAKRVSLPADEMKDVHKAIQISKAALPTLMIGEYPTLAADMAADYFCQGGLGHLQGLVRQHEGKAQAHKGRKEICVCVSFHMERLVGMFGVGEFPTGSKDPHGLRMSAVSVVNSLHGLRGSISAGGGIFLDSLVSDTVGVFVEKFGDEFRKAEEPVFQFIVERAKHAPIFSKFRREVADAVLAHRPLNFIFAVAKAEALKKMDLALARNLAEPRRRIDNIFRKSGMDIRKMPPVDESLFQQGEETDLFSAVQSQRTKVDEHVASAERETSPSELDLLWRRKSYRKALEETAKLARHVEEFFESVLINVDDEKIRVNRFALLAELRALLDRVVDISKLAG